MNQKTRPYIIAMTGASGAQYGIRAVQAMAELGKEIALVISESAKTVIREELNIEIGDLKEPQLERLFDRAVLERVTYYYHGDFTAPIASGSYPTQGMIVIPCSTTTLGRIAAGISQGLIERAAECVIKEGRKLVLVPRETPLSAIHLENMLKLARLGVAIVPAMPGFYARLQTVQEMVDFVVGKSFDSISITHGLFERWTGSRRAEPW